VDTQLSEDQTALEDSCRTLLEREWPLEQAMKTLGPGGSRHSSQLWSTLAEAGWLGLPFSVDLGGAGGDLVDLGLCYRAAGERLVPNTLYSCIFAELLIERLGSEAQKNEYLPPIIAGTSLATIAYSEPHAGEQARLFRTTATRAGTGWVLSGVKAFVPDVETADVIFVLANARSNSDRADWGLFAVAPDRVSGAVRRHGALGGEALYQIELSKVQLPADALLGGEAALPCTLDAFHDVVEQATALQCMEVVGGASAVLRRTVEYVSERQQHGRAIGSFQAVQHMLADVAIQLDGARVAALQALFLKSKGRPAAREVAISKIASGELYANATTTAHQVWGAMGYARESGVYLWSERAKVTDARFGTAASHLRKLADLMEM
jgi:alkylation response protein AidB-like acyl-CoA dehydrogenase